MLWGGRFSKDIDKFFLDFSSSIQFDINLLKYDLMVSRAHAKMLGQSGNITKDESREIVNGLDLIEAQFVAGNWNPLEDNQEDIHSAVENYLTKLIGDVAGKLHTARSRNDQVATGFRLWVKDSSRQLIDKIVELQKAFIDLSEQHVETIIPGYTHLQRAQPVSLAFHLLAYVEMFERDKTRLLNVIRDADVCPLGSGALAGTTLNIDREYTAKELGFSKVSSNALDSISDRDFVIDFLNACSVGMMHLSRLCEELILWSSSEWSFIQMDDSVTTGSSLMPQKKNPDAAELIRGKYGRVQGNYIAVSSMMKSLPLSYNRDMQEDKEPAFDSFTTFHNSLHLTKMMFNNISINVDRFKDELEGDYIFATDLADYLVSKGIPFRKAHQIVGEAVSYAISQNKKLNELSVTEFQQFDQVFDNSVYGCFDVSTSLDRKKSFGSPNPALLRQQIQKLKSKFS